MEIAGIVKRGYMINNSAWISGDSDGRARGVNFLFDGQRQSRRARHLIRKVSDAARGRTRGEDTSLVLGVVVIGRVLRLVSGGSGGSSGNRVRMSRGNI